MQWGPTTSAAITPLKNLGGIQAVIQALCQISFSSSFPNMKPLIFKINWNLDWSENDTLDHFAIVQYPFAFDCYIVMACKLVATKTKLPKYLCMVIRWMWMPLWLIIYHWVSKRTQSNFLQKCFLITYHFGSMRFFDQHFFSFWWQCFHLVLSSKSCWQLPERIEPPQLSSFAPNQHFWFGNEFIPQG